MKKLVSISLFAFLSVTTAVKAQVPFTTVDSVDVNHLHANVLVHGDMWYDPVTFAARCYSENDSENITGGGGIWISGYDASGQLHIAAQDYRDSGVDYWPGPLDASGNLTYATSQNWAKIWKVNRSDIQYFQALASHTTGNTPQAILTWPAKGNANAQGNGGAALTITNDMAPFVDLNGNGIYEPLLGEYPDIKGDQALWWVFSDNGPTHSNTHGNPLGVEIHAMAYGYGRGTLIDNVIYYEYTIVNRSPDTYTNFRIAQWEADKVGYTMDNFIGFDSSWRMGITYKGTNDDGVSGVTQPGAYGLNPPMSAVTLIVLPGDAGSTYVPAGCFNYYNNDLSSVGNPYADTEYNNYMRSKSKTGVHLKNDFAGAGVPSDGYGPGPDCNYVFTGDPKDTSQWSECICANNPGEKRSVLSSNDFTLGTGASQKVVLARITTNRVGGCPVASFDSIKVVADTAWNIYYNPLPLIPAGINNVPANNGVTIYPNPAHDKLFIENTGNSFGEEYITIYNSIGQVMNVPVSKSGQITEVGISQLPVGLYNVLYRQGSVQQSVKFIKE